MLYAARKLIEQAFTLSAVNTQITALNTAFSVSATALGDVMNGHREAPKDGDTFPLLVHFVGKDSAAVLLREFGKRDTQIPVRLMYLSRHATIASAEMDIEIALEAMQPILETLPGLQWGSTGRYCINVLGPVVEFNTYKITDEVVRHGGEMRFTMLMRTEG
jgi:hypothetical protein